jgi:hypothetical protein
MSGLTELTLRARLCRSNPEISTQETGDPLDSISLFERLEKAIFLIRGEKVMLDRDLAELYGVETRTLTESVRRNLERFPADFM